MAVFPLEMDQNQQSPLKKVEVSLGTAQTPCTFFSLSHLHLSTTVTYLMQLALLELNNRRDFVKLQIGSKKINMHQIFSNSIWEFKHTM